MRIALPLALSATLAMGAGCRGFEHDTGPFESCDAIALEPGRVRARRMPCDDEAIDGGEGRRADYVIENAWVRFAVRHPGAPLTLLDGGGGTIIDAAPVDGTDTLSELVPLVGAGWLGETTLELEQGPDGAAIHVTGYPVSIDFLEGLTPDVAPAGPVTISYRLGPDDRALNIVGADGFWLLPHAGAQLAGSTLRVGGEMLGIDGDARDLGGGVLVSGGSQFAVGAPSQVMAALWPGGDAVSGITQGTEVEVFEGERLVGWLPVDDAGAFEGVLPVGADGLRALADGHSAGPLVAASEGVELPLGTEGWLGVRVVDRAGVSHSALVTAVDDHGSRVLHPVDTDGAWLPLGGGAWEIEVDAGPQFVRARHRMTAVQGSGELDVVLDGPGPPSGWVLADLWVETWPSRWDRRPASLALAQAAARGVGFAVVGAPDEVGAAELERPWTQSISTGDGSWAASDQQGTVLAWPVNSNRRKPGHGAVDWYGLPAEDILRVAAGSTGLRRLLVVDLPWIHAAGPSLAWDPRPDMVSLDSFQQLDDLLALYDAWVDLVPTGPATWVRLGHDDPFGAVDVERGLVEGRTVAGTGPFVLLEVDGLGSGELSDIRGPHWVHLAVQAPRDLALEGAALIVDGEVYEQWDLRGGLADTRLELRRTVSSSQYVMAVAWGPQDLPSPHWAITAPIWTGRPQ